MARAAIPKGDITLFNKNLCTKTSFSESDMKALCDRKWGQVMGPNYSNLIKSFSTERMLMIDRITDLIPGTIRAEMLVEIGTAFVRNSIEKKVGLEYILTKLRG